MAECIGGRCIKWRGGLDHSTIVYISLFVYLSISNYDIKVVRYYPNREVICTMDGFKLHHNMAEALKTLSDNNNRDVKEEGGCRRQEFIKADDRLGTWEGSWQDLTVSPDWNFMCRH